ncbi:MAG: 1-deoxy-D-xylulose-5-phosphate synthase [Ruminococcaceae bacterium]|nr:1-deoxy-D-xylulose-5-phosphate synthase [Oscillospiraceae bacterium]
MSHYLDSVNSPKDIKKLNTDELTDLCSEIRKLMVKVVSENGGHLASNLGAVELTVAMHKVFNSPTDQFVFDVGHQSYTHKILTGRRENFETLRTEGGISGFTRPDESEHDIFSSGHSSTSISSAIGLAKAKSLRGEKGKVIAVIGDGALTGGLAYEGLNNNECSNLVVILNDNNMSISPNVGTMAKNLTTIRTSPRYFTFKSKITRFIARIPRIGAQLTRSITAVNQKIRKRVYKNTFFEDLGFRYYGPIDGHNLDDLIDALNVAKAHSHSVLIHVNTVKGKGYEHAEKNPSLFHGIGKFNIETGEPISSGDTFSSVFGKSLMALAEKDSRVCAITAAMSTGTGLVPFSEKYPKRFFDVGIAEQHAVTFSGGLARNGMIPFFAVYSTFLQRSYDQLIHDVAMQHLKVIFCIDRAGFVGEDGESHQGIFDTAFLMSVPHLTMYAPTYFEELSSMMYQAIYKEDDAVAIRYPRGKACEKPEGYEYNKESFSVFGDSECRNCIITYGREFCQCYNAVESLDNTYIIKLNRIKPVAPELCDYLRKAQHIFFFEEGIKCGGVGEHVGAMLSENGITAQYHHIAVEDGFVKQAPVSSQLQRYRLDAASIISEVKAFE